MKVTDNLVFIKHALPELKINNVQVNDSGWDNDIIIINRELVFRFPKNHEIAGKVLNEVTLLESFKKQQPNIDIPEYTVLWNEDKSLSCVCYRYIKGVSISYYDQIPNIKENAELLGEFLTKLHRTENSAQLKTVHTYDFWNSLYKSVKDEIYPFLTKNQQHLITETFESFLLAFESSSHSKTIIHGDLTASNIIISKDYERISGIIDFTDAQIGDPAFDFAGFYWNFGPEFTKAVLSKYNGPESVETIYNRVQSFYGIQPIFHELLHAMHKEKSVNWETAFSKFHKLKLSSI